MLFPSWLRNLAFRADRLRAGRPRQAPRRLLSLEELESRAVPSAGVQDLLYVGNVTPDLNFASDSVQTFNAETGAPQKSFAIPTGSGGVQGLIIDHHGNLLVATQNPSPAFSVPGDIFRYDGSSGKLLNTVISHNDPHAPFAPQGIVLRGNTLYVADLQGNDTNLPDGTPVPDGKIEEYTYNERTGAAVFKGEIDAPPSSDFQHQFHPRGLVFGPDGILYVSVRNLPAEGSPGNGPPGGAVLRFNAHTNTFLGAFVTSDQTNDLQRPDGLVFGPDGNLYVTSFRQVSGDNDKIEVFAGPETAHPGAFLGKIDLDQAGHPRAFAQALLFGPDGKLFVPISGNGPDTGEVRRYDVKTGLATGAFDVFIPPGTLDSPQFLTFRKTDPATLAYRGGEEGGDSLAAGLLRALHRHDADDQGNQGASVED
jgi:sugar lactone lactonase YvrE